MATRMHVKASLLSWAVQRSGLERRDILTKFPRFDDWLQAGAQPTLDELEKFSHLTKTPLGFLFLPDPPTEPMPIHDFRTWGNQPVRNPSVDLLDTIYVCQLRQDWYRDYAQAIGKENLSFVGSMNASSTVVETAGSIRVALGLTRQQRQEWRGNVDDAWRWLVEATESLGVLVMVSGIVGGDTHRVLKAEEFRGFSIVDSLAPIVFVNAVDSKPSKAPRMFTLAHELAHVWAGESGVSSADPSLREGNDRELWANKVAAEVLVPRTELARMWNGESPAELQRLRKAFCVSTLVILNSALDHELMSWDNYHQAYASESARIAASLANKSLSKKGGDYYKVQPYRTSRRFAQAVIADTWEGRTLFTEAYSLLGVRKRQTFERFAEAVMA